MKFRLPHKDKIKANKKIIIIAAIILVVAIVLFGRGGKEEEQAPEVIKKQISIQEITKQDEVTSTLSVSGTVVPRQYTVIRSLTQGTLEFIHPAGTDVTAGTPLFTIRDDNVENSYFNALQNLRQTNLITDERVTQAKLALSSAEARQGLAENNLKNTISQADQLLLNTKASAIINYGSAYNTLSQFYNTISNGDVSNLQYKYRDVVTTHLAVREDVELQHLQAAQVFITLPSTIIPENLEFHLNKMNNMLAQSKILADTTTLLLQNTLGGIDDLAGEKTAVASYQTQINTHVATILTSQNSLRNAEISNDLSINQSQNQLELANIELANAQISLTNAQSSALLEKIITQNQVDNAAYHFSNLALASPFSGTVLGTLVEAGQQVSVGQELLELGNIAIVEIEVEVDTEFGAGLKQGDTALINGIYEGLISEVEPVGSLASGKIGVKIQGENTEGFLVAGEIADVEFHLTFNQPELIIIPIKAATIEPASTYVFVVENGKAIKRDITLGRVFGSQVSVTSGLAEGDKLIIKNGVFISEGNDVEIVE